MSKLQFLKYKDFISSRKEKKSDKFAVISGGTGRIGSIFINELLFLGYKVAVISRSKEKFNILKKQLPSKIKNNIFWHQLDFDDPCGIDSVVKNILKINKNINCLINCTSSSNRGKNFIYEKNNLIKELLGTFGTTFLITEKLLPYLRKNCDSKIINIGSLWGNSAPRFETYLNMDIAPTAITSSGKSALFQYTRFLASRESKFNISCNCLVPGWFPRKGKVIRKDYIRKINQNIPLGRIGKLEDLITAISFLLSDNTNYYNGQSLVVDGGYSIY
jgi:NAD(P)-dependent dehydrogenase (short-subunit alcohol dehydrogenase family)